MKQAKLNEESKIASVRVRQSTKVKAEALLIRRSKDESIGKIKAYDLWDLALSLVTEEHIKSLQGKSVSWDVRKEKFRQRYIKTVSPISKNDFTGFSMTPAFWDFAKLHPDIELPQFG